MITLEQIPVERLTLLDTLTLFRGSHSGGTGVPDCKHCARELIHEVVTGVHKDATPPGITAMVSVLPGLNDGPWRDNAHRTEVMRPYLRKILLLDPIKDEQRAYAIIDHVYRKDLPDICDALKLGEHGSALRALAPIIDAKSAQAALVVRAVLDALDALLDAQTSLDALDTLLDAQTAQDARAILDARAVLDAQAALDALDAPVVRTSLDALDAPVVRTALDALAALAALNALHARDAWAVQAALTDAWEIGVRTILDLICAI